VTVSANGGIVVGTREVKAAELSDVLAERLAETPAGIVVIHNEEETTYGDFVKVLGLAKKAGAERIVVKFVDNE